MAVGRRGNLPIKTEAAIPTLVRGILPSREVVGEVEGAVEEPQQPGRVLDDGEVLAGAGLEFLRRIRDPILEFLASPAAELDLAGIIDDLGRPRLEGHIRNEGPLPHLFRAFGEGLFPALVEAR
jgi:hypothetical protein